MEEKFITYLENYLQKIGQEKEQLIFENKSKSMEERVERISQLLQKEFNLKKLLDFLKNDEYSTTYKEFVDIEKYLEEGLFNTEEKTKIIFLLIEKNWKNLNENPQAKNLILDMDTLKQLYSPDLTPMEFEKQVPKSRIMNLIEKKKETLTKENRLLLEKIQQAIKNEKEYHALFIRTHQYIAEHCLNKKDAFTSKDIQFVKVSLKYLGISKNLVKKIVGLLLKELADREKNNNQEVGEKDNSVKNENSPKGLTRKEYNAIYKEVLSFYDIQEYKVIRPLTKYEIIYLVSLLIKINLPEAEIKKCIQDINWHGVQAYENPIEAFHDYKEKIKKNCTYAEVEVVLNNVLEYIELIETEEDYLLWKEEITEELKKIRNILNQDDTYELEEGRKLYRSRKMEELKK